MYNIWSFLLQTIHVSLAACLLLAVKKLLTNHLSPRWQYSIWALLALRILIPSQAGRQILLPVGLWVETWKAAAEKLLDSAFSQVYTPISMTHVLPLLPETPLSLTDWLFAAYAAGVLIHILWYLGAFLRLRLLLQRGHAPSDELCTQIAAVCQRWDLKACKTIELDGLPTPFVCGLLRPVLVVPTGTIPDEKVLLHELLHLKYRDALQNMLWCLLRCLHWCNPLMLVIFRRIGNDMEALCDQRVLERLDGEALRDYGRILLSMANQRYARAPGTTSISNGGSQITHRIEAIVRFRKYPKGMALASVCIFLVLISPLLIGSSVSSSVNSLYPVRPNELNQAMALARIRRCSTIAGALDVYAAGLTEENGILLAMASPLSDHAALEQQMRYFSQEEDWVAYHVETGPSLTHAQHNSYGVYSLEQHAKDRAAAKLVIDLYALTNDNGTPKTDEDGALIHGSLVIPVELHYDHGWTVTQTQPPVELEVPLSALPDPDTPLMLQRYTAHGSTGDVTMDILTKLNLPQNQTADPDARFTGFSLWYYAAYTKTAKDSPAESCAIELVTLASPSDTPEFSGAAIEPGRSFGSSNGSGGACEAVTDDWDGMVFSGSGTGYQGEDVTVDDFLPSAYAVCVYWDGKPMETLLLTPQQPEP